MSNEIATITPAGTAVSLPAEITEQTKADARNAWAAATQRIYKNGWRVWTNWAALYGVVALPADPERVADFLSNLGRSRKMSTLRGYLSAISAAHRSAKVQFDPEAEAIKRVMKGLGRNKVGDLRKAAPLLPQHVQAALKADAKPTLLDYRDCALLGLGLAMAARRSELVGLDLGTRGDGDDCVGVLELRDGSWLLETATASLAHGFPAADVRNSGSRPSVPSSATSMPCIYASCCGTHARSVQTPHRSASKITHQSPTWSQNAGSPRR